jgi:gliding motility-associated-like protein
MKTFFILLISLIASISGFSQAGGITCAQMEPICTDAGVSFTANSGGPSASSLNPGNNYGCLSTTPNPSWFYLEIATAGNIIMSLTANSDIDFIIWGPFSSLSAAQAACGTYNNIVPNTSCTTQYLFGIPIGTTCLGEGCSYDPTNQETPGIPNAQVGQVYVMLVTNYANTVQNITLTQTGGTGSTDCTILQPDCNISYFEATIGACQSATNTYNINGVIEFQDAPTTGNLIVQDCFGTQHVVATAPFPSSGTVNYTINGLPANGAACSLSAFFSADPSCSNGPINYTAPACSCFMSFISTNISACSPSDNTFSISGTVEFTSPPTTGNITITSSCGGSVSYPAPFTSPLSYTIPGLVADGTTNCTVTASFTAAPTCSITSLSFNEPSGCLCTAEAGTFSQGTTGSTNSTGPLQYNLCFGDNLNIIANGDYTPPQDFSPLTDNNGNPITYDPGIWLLVYDCLPTLGPPSTINADPCLLGVASTADQAWSIVNNSGDNSTFYFVPVTMYSMVDGYYAISINGGNWCYDLGPTYAVTFLRPITATQTQTCTGINATISGGLPSLNGSQFTAVSGSLVPANASFVNTTAANGGTIGITGLTAGQGYSFQVIDANNCPITFSGTFVGPPTLTYPQSAYCPVGTASPTITGASGGTYSSTAGLSISSTTGVINLAASTPGTYTVTYTTPAVPGPACPATFDLTVHPLPIVVANDVTVCQGGSVTVSATGANTYSWSPGTYLSATTGASVTFSNGSTTDYTVTGTDANGCINTDPLTVTVNGNAPINAGIDVAICAGESTILTASGGDTYNWDNSLGAGASHTVSPTTTTVYTVNGTDANGCLGTDAVTVTVNPNPTPIINGSSTYCAGNPATLGTTQTFTSYLWSTGSTAATTSATSTDNPITVQVSNSFGCTGISPVFNVNENPVIIYNSSVTICQGESATIHGVTQTTAGVYSETFTTPSGCDSVANITLIVNPLPPVNAGIDQTVCFGSTVTLTGSGAILYNWSGSIQNNVPFTPQFTQEYTITGTDVNGCVNSDNVMVTVNSIPIINAGPDQSVCQGTSITLEGIGGSDYSWSGGISNGIPFVPSVGTNTYTVTGTSPEGCTSTDQVVVVVNPTPTVFAGNDVTICEGQTVTLTGSGAATYTWDNNINNGAAFNPSLGTTTYTVTGTSSAGCVNTDQVDVTVSPIPDVSFLPGATLGCAPFTTTLTNTSTNSDNCTWTLSNGQTLTGCGTIPVTFQQAGCYDVTLTTTSTTGCSSSFTASNLICVEAPPNAAFSPSANQVSNLDTEVNFINNTTGASNYVWSFGDDSGTSTEINPSHTYPTDPVGQYEVMLIAYSPFGCTDTAYSTIQIYEELIFYVPNTFTPDSDKFNPVFLPVFTAGFDPYDYNLIIFNRWGEIIFESNNAEVGWDGSYGKNGEIEMCQDGTYTWKIEFKVTRWDERRMAIGHVNLIR